MHIRSSIVPDWSVFFLRTLGRLRQQPFPLAADDLQPTLHGAARAAKFGSHLTISEALEFQSRDVFQRPVAQIGVQPVTRFGELNDKLGRGLAGAKLVEARRVTVGRVGSERGLSDQSADVAFLPPIKLVALTNFSSRDDQQQSPQTVAIGEVIEAAVAHTSTQTVKGTLSGIVLVVNPPRVGPKFPPRNFDNPPKEMLPQIGRGFRIGASQFIQPESDGVIVRHSQARGPISQTGLSPGGRWSFSPGGRWGA